MSERKFDYNEVSKDGLVDMAEEAELKLGKLSSRIAALEAQNWKLVEALADLMARLDDHFGGNPDADWREQETARALLSEVAQ